MPEVTFDPQFKARSAGTSGYLASAGPYSTSLWNGFAVYAAGTLDTDLETMLIYNDIPGFVIPDTGLLIKWESHVETHTITAVQTGSVDLGLITLTIAGAVAVETGVAAEFVWFQTNTSKSTQPTDTQDVNALMTGAVSVSGGSGDLVIDNVNITSGSSYSISQFRHKIYQDFQY